MDPKVKKTLNTISNVLVVLLIALTLVLGGAWLAGLRTYTVLSGSMEPTYHTGSVIYVKKIAAEDIQAGTVITFMLNEDTVVTHRVVEVVPDEEDPTVLRFRTKGDANDAEDGGLEPERVEDVDAVFNDGYPLVLYTCTPGGKARVAVFCQWADDSTPIG